MRHIQRQSTRGYTIRTEKPLFKFTMTTTPRHLARTHTRPSRGQNQPQSCGKQRQGTRHAGLGASISPEIYKGPFKLEMPRRMVDLFVSLGLTSRSNTRLRTHFYHPLFTKTYTIPKQGIQKRSSILLPPESGRPPRWLSAKRRPSL